MLFAPFVLIVGMAPDPAAVQTTGAKPAAPSAISACSLLTKELAMKFSPAGNKAVFDMPPDDSSVGTAGSNCEYGAITLQIDSFTPARLDGIRKSDEKAWLPVSGVGDWAYFRNNRNIFAELIGVVGSRTFFIQMGVPFKGTAEGVRPNMVGLANAIIPKLR
jgi:hypothetical protein